LNQTANQKESEDLSVRSVSRPLPRAAVTGTALLALTLTGCSSNSGGSGNSPTGSSSAGASSPAATASTAAATTASTGSTDAAGSGSCTPQTTSVSSDTATQVLQTLASELSKACGFTVSGYLDGAAELPDGLSIQGNATVDAAGNAHVAVDDQGVVIDVYQVSGSDYVHMYEAGEPTAAPDANVEAAWGNALSSSEVTAAGQRYVKLTSTQASSWASGGMEGNDVLLTPSKLATDLATGASGWSLAGTATVDGVQCVKVSAPAAEDGPATTISVNASTGLPVQVAYTVSGSSPNTLVFSGYGSTATVTAPSDYVDGASLS
jgi:hypothetical protein